MKTIREDKKETNVFLAALQGVDLNKHYNNPVEDKRAEIERRAAVRAAGSEEAYERQEFAEFGIDFGEDD